MHTSRLSLAIVLVLGLVLSGCAAEPRENARPTVSSPEQNGSSPGSWRKDRFITIAEAVERLQPHVDVPVVLPRDSFVGLPTLKGWMADPEYLDWRADDGIRSGGMKILKGRQMLILSYGLAGFDGCGGRDHAIETNVLGQPALVSQAREHLWSHIIWPVTDTGATGRYGITGTFEGWQIVRLARSMERTRLAAMDVTKNC